MHRSRVKRGLQCLSGSILLVTLISFASDGIAQLFSLTGHGRHLLILWGLLASGAAGCASIAVILRGAAQTPSVSDHVRLAPSVFLLLLVLLLFILLLHHSGGGGYPPRLHPGDTINI